MPTACASACGVCSPDGSEGPSGDGPYTKPSLGPVPHAGMVHTVAGNASEIAGGSLDHPAMEVSFNMLGSVVLDVNGGRLDATFLDKNGVIQDQWTMIKGSVGGPPIADFLAAPRSGTVPMTVSFLDETLNEPTTWIWDGSRAMDRSP